MLIEPPLHPRPYADDVEQPEAGEAEVGQELAKTMHKISEVTFKDGGHALRSVHAKSHGVLKGELEILADLPQVLAQGLFGQPGKYPVVMRFSTTPGDIMDDSVSTPRGLAIKVLGVSGERLPGAPGDTQDFVMVNGKTFSAPNAKVFLANLKMLAATTDKAEGLKKVVSVALQGAEKAVETLTGAKSATLTSLGGQAETNILGESFYSQVPIRYGDYIAKIAVVPVSPKLTALTDAPIKTHGHPNAIREAVIDHFAANPGEWEVRVQLCTDLDDMPVENAAKAWPEDKSPYLTVARLTAQPQLAWSDKASEMVDDGMAFSPWHGLAAHRPLGSIMRLRKQAYDMSARFRSEHNATRVQEPRSFDPPQ